MDPMMMMALGGLLGGGGGDTNVSQTATNSSSINLSSLLQTGGSATSPVSGGATASGASGSGAPAPSPSPLSFPSLGMDSPSAAAKVTGNQGVDNRILMVAGAGLVGAVGISLFMGGRKRKKKGG